MRATATARVGTYTGYATPGHETTLNAAKGAAMVLAAPMLGLAFVVAAPFAGLGALAWLAARAFIARFPKAAAAIRNVTLFLAAPFIGLAYALAAPFVGLGALVWLAARAARERKA